MEFSSFITASSKRDEASTASRALWRFTCSFNELTTAPKRLFHRPGLGDLAVLWPSTWLEANKAVHSMMTNKGRQKAVRSCCTIAVYHFMTFSWGLLGSLRGLLQIPFTPNWKRSSLELERSCCWLKLNRALYVPSEQAASGPRSRLLPSSEPKSVSKNFKTFIPCVCVKKFIMTRSYCFRKWPLRGAELSELGRPIEPLLFVWSQSPTKQRKIRSEF